MPLLPAWFEPKVNDAEQELVAGASVAVFFFGFAVRTAVPFQSAHPFKFAGAAATLAGSPGSESTSESDSTLILSLLFHLLCFG